MESGFRACPDGIPMPIGMESGLGFVFEIGSQTNKYRFPEYLVGCERSEAHLQHDLRLDPLTHFFIEYFLWNRFLDRFQLLDHLENASKGYVVKTAADFSAVNKVFANTFCYVQ